MNKTEQIRQMMAEITAITGFGAASINIDGLEVVDGAGVASPRDTHYCPECAFFGRENCISGWLRNPVDDDIVRCPGGHCFAHVQLLEGDLFCGLLMLGPLPQALMKNQFRLSALHTMLQSFGCLMEKRGLLPRRNDAFAVVSRYVSGHLTDELSMEALQANLYLSASTISRVIKQESGLPLRLYIQSRRLDAAKKLLLTTSLPVIQVAEQCGINDFNYFSRIFKKQYGMSPTAMRTQSEEKHGL